MVSQVEIISPPCTLDCPLLTLEPHSLAEDNDASLDPDLFGGHLDEGDEGELSGLKNPLVVTPSKVLTDDSGRRREFCK